MATGGEKAPEPLLVLVGPPGSGKSAVGRALAKRLGVAFRDTDADVEREAGKPISDIFVQDGEPAFREMEHEAVTRAVEEHTGVLSLGGGAVLDQRTRARLAGLRVVWLRVGLSTGLGRVGVSGTRPVLALSPRAQYRALLEQRQPLYEEVATVQVDTDGRTVAQVVAAAMTATGLAPAERRPG